MVNEYGESTGVDSPSNVEGSSTPRPEAPASRQTPTGPVPSKVQQPKPQVLPSRSTPSALLVSTRQKGNPILNHIKLLPWEYADIPADYVVGTTTCALFLSLKYHRLHPEYIYSRIRLLAGKYLLRILLIMVDIPNHEDSLKELSKTSIINNLTLTLCWSAPEAAHYLELFKSSENSQPTAIRTQQAQSYKESLIEFVTAPRSINKSDAASLISTFGSLQNAINAQPEQISAVPGWGEKKVRQWCNAVREDFRVEASRKTAAPAQNLYSQKNNEPTSRNSKMSTSTNAHNEDEEAMLAAESEGAHVGSQEDLVERVHPDKAAQREGMSDGIVAALAKLRESGG
ncbi:restriction endonuclease type II-like protein [Aspergillus caelatus]|uniref:Restriction endonuclease type II-like protein n=2 Tax=Aspergillus subgen. Circumdati TaxID=2720871 RepID=A0A5N6ZSW1_9EURO|nr:restriction endonuclease type II-like protein [Aspergillus caelatus]KAE8360343.1 restriction endonuclease type II-like protein [Aspergillus caelatus]KAE8411523.1 restriction endonuclease type II-like protein [Aspergillus pseudocaelatus]